MIAVSVLNIATRQRGGLCLLGVVGLALLMLGGCGMFKKKQDGEMTLVQMRFFGSYNDRLIMGYRQKKARGWDVCGLASYDLSKQEVLQIYPSAEGYCMETPAVSYDNEWIAFGYYQQGRDDYLEQIGIMRADGSDWRLLTDTDSYKAHPSFSADGKKLIFLSARSKQRKGRKTMVQGLDAWEVEIDTGNLRQLTNISAYGMSPPQYMPREPGNFLISPNIFHISPLKRETFFNAREIDAGLLLLGSYSNTHKSRENGRGISGSIIDGTFYTHFEIDEISKSNADAFESKYGNNFIFMLSDKGDLSKDIRRQPHDFSEPLFSVYEKRDLAAEGEPYINPDHRFYANFPSISLDRRLMLFRGGDKYTQTDLFLRDMLTGEIDQLTKSAINEYVQRPWLSADGQKVVYWLHVEEMSYSEIGIVSQLAPGRYYFTIDLDVGGIMPLDGALILDKVKEHL